MHGRHKCAVVKHLIAHAFLVIVPLVTGVVLMMSTCISSMSLISPVLMIDWIFLEVRVLILVNQSNTGVSLEISSVLGVIV